jgi:hypothetical protein
VSERRAVVLVEGISDRIAVEAIARRQGRDLAAEGVSVVPIGGAQAIRRALDRHRGSRLAGLCDAAEEGYFRRALGVPDRAAMEALGFFVCSENLEDELIRAVGPARVEEILAAEGDLETFRAFQNQPAWRGRPVEAQLRRWLHAADRRNTRYPPLLVAALDPDRIPRPLALVLAALG